MKTVLAAGSMTAGRLAIYVNPKAGRQPGRRNAQARSRPPRGPSNPRIPFRPAIPGDKR